MLYSFKIVFPTRQVLFTSAVAVVKPTFHAITAEIAVCWLTAWCWAGGWRDPRRGAGGRRVVGEGDGGAAGRHLLQHRRQHLAHGRGQDLAGEVHDVLRDAAAHQELRRLVREVVAVVSEQIVPVAAEPVPALGPQVVLEHVLRDLGLAQLLHLQHGRPVTHYHPYYCSTLSGWPMTVPPGLHHWMPEPLSPEPP